MADTCRYCYRPISTDPVPDTGDRRTCPGEEAHLRHCLDCGDLTDRPNYCWRCASAYRADGGVYGVDR